MTFLKAFIAHTNNTFFLKSLSCRPLTTEANKMCVIVSNYSETYGEHRNLTSTGNAKQWRQCLRLPFGGVMWVIKEQKYKQEGTSCLTTAKGFYLIGKEKKRKWLLMMFSTRYNSQLCGFGPQLPTEKPANLGGSSFSDRGLGGGGSKIKRAP